MSRKKKEPTPPPPAPSNPPPPASAGEIFCGSPEAYAKVEKKLAERRKDNPAMPEPRIVKGYEEGGPK